MHVYYFYQYTHGFLSAGYGTIYTYPMGTIGFNVGICTWLYVSNQMASLTNLSKP